jgi:hypothetical protein
MLTHIIVWKYKPETSEEERLQHIEALRALKQVIAEVEDLQVGLDTLRLPRSYDTALVARFRNREALDAYDAHPQHKQVAMLGRHISDHIASVDFED